MGWSSGSNLMCDIIGTIKREVTNKIKKEAIYKDLIEYFEDQDCDTLDECIGEDEVFDKVYFENHTQGCV